MSEAQAMRKRADELMVQSEVEAWQTERDEMVADAALLRQGADACERWEQLKAAIAAPLTDCGHHERYKAALGYVQVEMMLLEREP